MKFQNKIVLVTGASSGIGAATAREFAKNGAHVILVARSVEKLEQVTDGIRQGGGKASWYSVDLSDHKEVVSLSEKVVSEHGVPDVLINNAGRGNWKFIEETDYDEVAEIMGAPYYAAFYMTKAFLPHLKKKKSGHIVNMTSLAGFVAFSGATAYIASRTAMVGFHKALAADLRGSGISTSLCYFAKVQSEYWSNNPGSEERLPTSQKLIPTITSEQVAKKIVRGVHAKKKTIATPFMLWVMKMVIQYAPRTTNLIMNSTGYKG